MLVPAHDVTDPGLRALLQREMFGDRRKSLFWCRAAVLMLFGTDGRACVGLFRVSQALHARGHRRLAAVFKAQIVRRFGCTLHPSTRIGIGFTMPHPQGIVIGTDARIGRNCVVFQQVTIGAARLGEGAAKRYATIGDDCVLATGTKVIGTPRIGDRVLSGANAVIRADVPDDHVAVGVPAVNKARLVDA